MSISPSLSISPETASRIGKVCGEGVHSALLVNDPPVLKSLIHICEGTLSDPINRSLSPSPSKSAAVIPVCAPEVSANGGVTVPENPEG